MSKIFTKAKFGDKFKTRDKRVFVFLGRVEPVFGKGIAYQGMFEDDSYMHYYTGSGKSLYAEFNGSSHNASYVSFNEINSKKDAEDDIVSKIS